MYTDYWQLTTKPFEAGADPAFVYPCEQQRSAAHKLRYAIESRRAAVALVGPTGVGKTMLLEQLPDSFGEESGPVVRLYFPLMSPRDLLVYFAEQLGAPPADPIQQTVEESLRRLEFTLGEIRRRGQHAVLVVEEAHLLEDTIFSAEVVRTLLSRYPESDSARTAGPLLVRGLQLDPEPERIGPTEPPRQRQRPDPISPLLTVVPLPLLAAHAAMLRGHDVDKPRNLAKSVTVE